MTRDPALRHVRIQIRTLKEEIRSSFITTTVREQNLRSHHKGATDRFRTGDQRYPVLCHFQLGQDIPLGRRFAAALLPRRFRVFI